MAMDTTSSSEKASSSPIAVWNTSKKGMPGMVLTLNTHGTSLDRHEVEIAAHDEKIKQISNENKVLWKELDTLKKKERTIQSLGMKLEGFEGLYATMREKEDACNSLNSDSSDEGSDGEAGMTSLTQRERAAIEASEAAYRDNSMKELTRLSYMFLMGVGKLTGYSLPWYPENPDKDTWPRIIGTSDLVLRFWWDEPLSHDNNYYSMRMIAGYMRTHGSSQMPSATTLLVAISKDDLQRRVSDKFLSLRKALHGVGHLDSRNCRVEAVAILNITSVNSAGSAEGQIVMKEEKKGRHAAQLASRAAGKLVVRNCKRANLPAESIYQDKKYDTAFVSKLMSDDEEQLTDTGEKTGKYVSHAPAYRSKELIELFAAVDATKDPNPSA
ncbi:hypothetical protein C0992_001518, partial [Termitomyces sp. T32_za158]